MTRPALSAITELFKPITWFPPMWAFACGVVASGMPLEGRWGLALVGIALAGPFVCATSQAVNDWFDRHVDAINEPHRPIPSGRMPGRWGLYIAVLWTGLSLAVATLLGPWGFAAAVAVSDYRPVTIVSVITTGSIASAGALTMTAKAAESVSVTADSSTTGAGGGGVRGVEDMRGFPW